MLLLRVPCHCFSFHPFQATSSSQFIVRSVERFLWDGYRTIVFDGIQLCSTLERSTWDPIRMQDGMLNLDTLSWRDGRNREALQAIPSTSEAHEGRSRRRERETCHVSSRFMTSQRDARERVTTMRESSSMPKRFRHQLRKKKLVENKLPFRRGFGLRVDFPPFYRHLLFIKINKHLDNVHLARRNRKQADLRTAQIVVSFVASISS